MKDKLLKLKDKITKAVVGASNLSDLEAVEVFNLGRKSEFSQAMKELGGLSEGERREIGRLANEVKQEIDAAVGRRRLELQRARFASLADQDRIDVTVPGVEPPKGHLHLTTQAIDDIVGIFSRLGFTRVRHPEVEWDWFTFESLNMPPDHPARDEWETFFVDAPSHRKLGKMVLTPHTTSGSARELKKGRLPIRMINISKTYRRQIDVSHTPMFHQFEGLLVDRGVTVTHLKGVLDHFAHEFFGPDRRTRLRPFHFRFTEPSFEVDISCGICGGTGRLEGGSKCRLCKEGWLELGGAGMLHPNVLKAGGVDPDEYSALAFGWGVERTMMMRSGIMVDDIRVLYRSDFRFLNQF
ncbi:phenylalanine--tRNA ligase subunit alpha [Candidatus Uhrbacteria bacterium CG_4_10_14_0_8_um_filter_58_22]|uniref:Phenylalanine--tRNA ligase alpha subunit n=1 Tax=Candidatus Uhrbacteria bacterium CG_4_10_14_0_8_um_filter_58_22 TaxID=1975029 RepID=A0A2M7QAJ2_9BACT|nr:MAG: phenylalanine--tRNA ligase subunit alpha [Parcubacteria group bacterium CG1_02_58_44]PIY63150.1 MAG: phenylalanine--tRNA ligase subunit alpha [Candidatus Uhrbacteria bacterium CG_4_10_14_0_8_um_filter_58_22]